VEIHLDRSETSIARVLV